MGCNVPLNLTKWKKLQYNLQAKEVFYCDQFLHTWRFQYNKEKKV